MVNLLYVNGCSHTAAAEAVVPECFAVDDGRHGIDRRPHPVNLAASWCSHVAQTLGAELVCGAESGGSNARILRTTRAWIDQNRDRLDQTLMILQWTTWEREEWLHNGIWYQVNASGTDWLPDELHDRYRQYIVDIDWNQCTQPAHQEIWQLHQELEAQNVQHLFFSGHNTFGDIGTAQQQNWQNCYIYPYDRDQSYHNWLLKNGGSYATASSYHFDAKSHRLWAEYVLQYVNRNQILAPAHEISTD
jgi:hypothetical protein